jgi:hypothetical protein
MNKSESIKNIAGALVQFQASVSKVAKESNNPFFKSKYASLANILDTIQKPLSECGLAISQFPDGNALTTILLHADSGEWMESSYVMPVAKQNDPQAMGSAMTYARRYALGSILNLNIDDDDDGEKAMGRSNQPQMVRAKRPLTPGSDYWAKAVEHLKTGGLMTDITTKFEVSEKNQKLLIGEK